MVDVKDPKQLADYNAYFFSREEDVKSEKVHFVPLVQLDDAWMAEYLHQRKLVEEQPKTTQ